MVSRRRLILLGFNYDYAKEDVKSLSKKYNVKVVRFYKAEYLLLSFFNRLGFSSIKLYLKIAYYLKFLSIKSEDVVIAYDNSLSVSGLKHKSILNNKRILMFRNTYDENFLKNIEVDFIIYSFDEDDCVKYGFNYHIPFCSGAEYIESNLENKREIKNKIYFLGFDKGRESTLLKIKNNNPNCECDFSIFKLPSLLVDKIKLKILGDGRVPYSSHLDRVMDTSIVVDIVKEGLSTISLRTMEAVFANKKIITNNENVKKYDFYSKERFLLLSEMLDFKIPEDFLIRDLVPISSDELEKYKVVSVFEGFLGF